MKFVLLALALFTGLTLQAGVSPATHAGAASSPAAPIITSAGTNSTPSEATAAPRTSKRTERHQAKLAEATNRLQQLMAQPSKTKLGEVTHTTSVLANAVKAVKHARKLDQSRKAMDQTTSILVGALAVLLIILAFAIEPILGLVLLLIGVVLALVWLLT